MFLALDNYCFSPNPNNKKLAFTCLAQCIATSSEYVLGFTRETLNLDLFSYE